jgi:hypothetical protein
MQDCETTMAIPEPSTLLRAARRELERLPKLLDPLLAGLDDEVWRGRPAPDRWAPLEILCHLRDEEAEDFGARIRVVLAGGREFAPIRPAEWVIERRYLEDDPPAVLAAFHARRAENLGMLDSADPAMLAATGEARGPGGVQRLSGMDLLAAWVAHDQLHVRQLAGTLARLWATRLAALRVDYAGELPYEAPPA